MASFQVLISSERERARNPNRVIDPSDFVYNFEQPLDLKSLFCEVCLLKLNVWNSVRNVVGQEFNFTVQGTVSSLTIPDGQYSVDDLNALLQAHIAETIPAGVGDLIIRPNNNTNRVEIIIADAGASIDLNGYMAGFFGFSAFGSDVPVSVTGVGVHAGDFIAQVTNGADAYQVRIDLHNNAYAEGVTSDVLYQYTPASPPQSEIEVEPRHLIYFQVNKSFVTSIRVRHTDQTGKKLDFGGEDTSIVLHLREIR